MTDWVTFLPVVQRELLTASRQRATFRVRITVALGTSVIAAAILLVPGSWSMSQAGSILFVMLATVAFIFCLIEGTRHAADCLSEEKREGTLGLLFLTDLRGYDVVLGKLASVAIKALQGLFAFFPVLAVSLILGGTTLGEVWRAALVLLNALWFSLTLGLFISARSWHAHKALAATLGIMALFSAVPLLPKWLSWPVSPAGMNWLNGLSPAHAWSLVRDVSYQLRPEAFWIAWAEVQGMGWILLALASVILPKSWQDNPRDPLPGARTETISPSLRPKGAKRAQLLEINPIFWLAAREGSERLFFATLAAVLCGGGVIVILWLMGTGNEVFRLGSILISIALLALKIWLAAHASMTFAHARASGLLELVLVTPLAPSEAVRGQWLALRQFFLAPVVTLLIADALITSGEIVRQNVSAAALLPVFGMFGIWAFEMITEVLDLIAVAWVGVWMGISQKNPHQALVRTLLYAVLIPFLLFCIPNVLIDLILINLARPKINLDFRKLIGEREALEAKPPLLALVRARPDDRRQ